jgi:hypothetical protein
VIGARVAPDGSLLGTHTISAGDNDQLAPRLTFDGVNYLAVWTDRRMGPSQIFWARVAPDGTVLEPDGRRLRPQDSTNLQFSPVPASNGSGFLVTWMASATAGYVVCADRLSPGGDPLDSVPLKLTRDSVFQYYATAGTNGTDYLVVWNGEIPLTDSSIICCSRVSASGCVLDSTPITLVRSPTDFTDMAVAYLDGTYLVAWTDLRSDGDIFACRVLDDGTVLDTGGFAVCARPALQREPALAAGAGRFMVCWSDLTDSTFDVYATTVDMGGHVGTGGGEPVRVTRPGRLRPVPNPARGAVRFDAADALPVRIFDANGRLVQRLDSRTWDGRDNAGRPVSAGLYVAVSGRATCAFQFLR